MMDTNMVPDQDKDTRRPSTSKDEADKAEQNISLASTVAAATFSAAAFSVSLALLLRLGSRQQLSPSLLRLRAPLWIGALASGIAAYHAWKKLFLIGKPRLCKPRINSSVKPVAKETTHPLLSDETPKPSPTRALQLSTVDTAAEFIEKTISDDTSFLDAVKNAVSLRSAHTVLNLSMSLSISKNRVPVSDSSNQETRRAESLPCDIYAEKSDHERGWVDENAVFDSTDVIQGPNAMELQGNQLPLSLNSLQTQLIQEKKSKATDEDELSDCCSSDAETVKFHSKEEKAMFYPSEKSDPICLEKSATLSSAPTKSISKISLNVNAEEFHPSKDFFAKKAVVVSPGKKGVQQYPLNISKGLPNQEIRCKLWPSCKSGDECTLFHPSEPCSAEKQNGVCDNPLLCIYYHKEEASAFLGNGV